MTTELSPASHPWEYSAFPVKVVRKTRLSSEFIRITLGGERLRHFGQWGLDQAIKLVLPMADGSVPDFGLLDKPTPHPRDWYTRWKALAPEARNVLRTYTPAAIRPADREIDVDIFVHQPAGPASSWALACAPGEALTITGPDARVGYTGYGIRFAPPAPPGHTLLVGDASSLPAINNIIRALPVAKEATVILQGTTETLRLVNARDGLNLVTTEETGSDSLVRAITGWMNAAGERFALTPHSYAWMAGEIGAIARARRHVVEHLDMPSERVAHVGYWRAGGRLVL